MTNPSLETDFDTKTEGTPFITEPEPFAILDGARVFASENSKKLLGFGVHFAAVAEAAQNTRGRKRTQKAQRNFELAIEALLAEVIYRHLTSPELTVYLPLGAKKVSTKSRYKPSFFGKTYLEAINLLSSQEAGVLELEKGYKNLFNGPDVLSSIKPAWRLIATIGFLGLKPDDFARKWQRLETIILRGEPTGRHTWKKPGKDLEYDDTQETLSLRGELAEINEWLSSANISCIDPRGIDTQQRTLYRVFNNGSFTQGGRLYGGFWIPMSKTERASLLRLQGEPVVSLDFAQFNPRAAYGVLGLQPNFDDAYSVPGWPSSFKRRANAKIVMNQLLSATKIPERRPSEGWSQEDPIPYKVLRDDLIGYHYPIRELFGTGIGHQLAFKESQTMMSCLLELKSKGMVGLPVHDCLIVSISAKDYGINLMQSKALENTGVPIPVKVE